jgi:hypothetical protein
MLFRFALALGVAWLLGVLGLYSIGAYAYLLLGAAVLLTVVGMLSGRRGLA